jgi:membrane associated rhomboid family serine protease
MNEFRPQALQALPIVVKNIIIINVIVFFATIVLGTKGIDLGDYLALHSFNSVDADGGHLFRPWQLISHLFMHGGNMFGTNVDYEGGFMHLFGNMFGLWMFGSILEQQWGAKRFLNFYIICGIGAGLAHLLILNYEHSIVINAIEEYVKAPTWDMYNALLNKNISTQNGYSGIDQLMQLRQAWSNDPSKTLFATESVHLLKDGYLKSVVNETSVGASGAIYGILGAFAYLFPNTYLYIYFLFPVKVKYAIALYAIYELYSGIGHSAGDNIAHFAHLGGMVVGLLIVIFWNKTNRKTFY